MKKIFAVILMLALVFTLTACGGKEEAPVQETETVKEVVLADVLAGFTFDGEMMELAASDMLDLYGIEEADMKQFAAVVNTSGIDCDEVILVEAVDADAAARVKTCLDNRYQAKLNETENYLPDEFAIIKECAVSQNGNFVAMIVAPGAEDMVKAYEGAVK